jgi:2-dehydropantoate 2-reductase
VVGGVCYVVSGIEGPGVVRHSGGTRLLIGETEGGTGARIARVAAVLQGAGIAVEVPADIRVAWWQKFCLVCATGGVMALTRLPIGPVLACPETRAFFLATMQEAASIAQATGIPLPAGEVEQTFALVEGYPPWAASSMLQDVLAGRRLELEALNGAATRLGSELGIPMPANSAIYAALKPFVNGAPALPVPA